MVFVEDLFLIVVDVCVVTSPVQLVSYATSQLGYQVTQYTILHHVEHSAQQEVLRTAGQ